MDLVEILHLESVAVFCDEWFVVVGWLGGPGVDGGVVDADLDVVLTRFEVAGDVEAVWGVPEGADALAVDEDDGGFVDGWVVPGAHAGAGAGDQGVGERCSGGAGGVAVDGDLGAGAGEGSAAFYLEVGGGGGGGGQGEVAGVDGFAGVELCGWVGGPVG